MKKEVLDYVIEKTHELMNAASCSSEAKAAVKLRQQRRAGWMRSVQNGKPMKQKNILPNWKRILCRSTI